jgi:antitoxin MazE
MGTIVKSKIVKIGNSRGIRIPKPLLEQAGLSGPVEIEAQADQLIVRAGARPAPDGWDAAFQKMAANGDDVLLDAETLTASEWDNEEWQW